EIDDLVVKKADIIVVNIAEQSRIDEHGDLFEPVQRGIIDWKDLTEIGEIITGCKKGRSSSEQITLYKQNSDQGVGFMALAKLAYEVAVKNKIGIEI
ncbi:MAG: ornithine cyclodeaminase family protein, partial [Alphaproteobacteria bacterium]